jgi:pyruvate/2-oxoglutarate/acetoin dehydrogenase E1 component
MGDIQIKMAYKDELAKAMDLLGKNEKTIFLGQSVAYPGNAVYKTLEYVPLSKRIEMPIVEDLQMGMSTGLSLEGFIPVSIFPRMDFLILAINQLVNHLDKIKEMSNNQFSPKVIIRTGIGATKPLYPGLQHCSDYREALKLMLKNINVVKLENSKDIIPEYKKALESDKSTILIEVNDLYDTE